MNPYENTTASQLYERLQADRQPYIDTAEQCAMLTLPAVFPPEGRRGSLPRPRNWVGARGVNHITSRILMATFPAGSQFVRMVPNGKALKVLSEDEAVRAAVEKDLADIEREIQKHVASSQLRVVGADVIKQLVVVGNVLTKYPKTGEPTYFTLREYVVERDRSDNLLCIVLREELTSQTIDAVTRDWITTHPDPNEFGAGAVSPAVVTVYTKVYKDGNMWKSVQEINGFAVDGTEESYTPETMPWAALRWEREAKQAYGNSLLSQYQGTLAEIESLTKSLSDGAKIAARVVPLVNPTGYVDPRDLDEAENGQAIAGKEGDVTFLQVQKYADFTTAAKQLDEMTRAMSSVFLLNFARDAERVTAEEIRMFAQELETTHSGVFIRLSLEFQLPWVKGVIRRLEAEGSIGKVSNKKVADNIKPTPLTGIDALARGQDLQKMSVVFDSAMKVIPQAEFVKRVNSGVVLSFMMTSAGLDIPGAIRTDDEVDQLDQLAQENEQLKIMLQQATGPLATGLTQAGNQSQPQPTNQ